MTDTLADRGDLRVRDGERMVVHARRRRLGHVHAAVAGRRRGAGITVVVQTPPAVATLIDTAVVSTTTTDPDPSDNSASATTTTTAPPMLSDTGADVTGPTLLGLGLVGCGAAAASGVRSAAARRRTDVTPTATSGQDWSRFFESAPGYLDTASMGLPPTAAVDDVVAVLEGWRRGRVRPQDFDGHVERSRAAWAALAGVDPRDVAIGSTVSALVGSIAGGLPEGSQVLVAAGDFTSVLFPFLVQQQRRDVTVREVALDELVASVDEQVDLVAVSTVQSSDGRIIDVDALLSAAERNGSRVLLDTTQSCGWLPLDCSRVDYVVCAAYKWLLCPRGVAFLAVRPQLLQSIEATSAGWYAGSDVWASVYGTPLRLAGDAGRLDTSPAWFSWVGAAPALELLASLDAEAIRAHDVALADRFLAGLGRAAARFRHRGRGAEGAAERFTSAGVRAASRAGRARVSFHLYNDEADVDRALSAVGGTPAR